MKLVRAAIRMLDAVECGPDNGDNPLPGADVFFEAHMSEIGLSPLCRRTAIRLATLTLCWTVSSIPAARAQDSQMADIREASANEPAEIPEGLWPSPNLMRLMLSRWAEQAAYEYDLDDDQKEQTRKAVIERWTKYLDENRDEIQPLANEFLEMRMELEPPDKERVMKWAKRARPQFESARKQIEEGSAEFRQILRPNQRLKFEIDAMQMKLGMGLAGQKFVEWEKGEFEPDDFWEPLGEEREARRDERRQRRKEREALEAERERKRQALDEASRDPVDLEMDAWQRYVADFIIAYGLDAGQRTTVLSCLTELRNRALAHRDRYREDIDRLEDRIASNSGTDEELAEIKIQLEKLYGPIDEMFQELRSRLEQVPTGDQRASAQGVPLHEAQIKDRPKPAADESPRSNEPASLDEDQTEPKTDSPTNSAP